MKPSDKTGSWLPLAGLTFAVFVFNTSEFMPIGLLSDIATDFGTTPSRVGLIISIYAWVVALMSLPLMVMASSLSLRRLLLGVVGLFAVCQVTSALSAGYYTLLASRIGVACAHSIFWSIAPPLAVRTVPQGRRALGLSTIATGSAVAMVVGLPLGRMIGLYMGWRTAFMCIAIVAAAIFAFLYLVFPRLESRGRFTFSQIPHLLRNRALLGIYVASLLFATAHYTGYSYIEPFLSRVAGMSADMVTLTLVVFGVSGLLGSWAFSRYYVSARYRFVGASTIGPVLVMALLLPLAFSVSAIIVLCVAWSALATAFNIACQDNVIRYAPEEATPVAMSIFSGIFNLGIGSGAFVGGAISDHLSLAYIGYAGAVICLLAFAYCWLRLFPDMRRAEA